MIVWKRIDPRVEQARARENERGTAVEDTKMLCVFRNAVAASAHTTSARWPAYTRIVAAVRIIHAAKTAISHKPTFRCSWSRNKTTASKPSARRYHRD